MDQNGVLFEQNYIIQPECFFLRDHLEEAFWDKIDLTDQDNKINDMIKKSEFFIFSLRLDLELFRKFSLPFNYPIQKILTILSWTIWVLVLLINLIILFEMKTINR